jgi:hypothetical protein
MLTTQFTLETQKDGVVVESAYILDPKTGDSVDTIYATTENGETTYHSHSGEVYDWKLIQPT